MNVNTQRNLNNNIYQPNFGNLASAVTTGLRFLDTNKAWGATAVDFTCMVAPRSITDFARNPKAGAETARRESSGTLNHAAIGLAYGPIAGMIMGQAINSKYGINSRKIYADSETVDLLGKYHFDIIKNSGKSNVQTYAENIAKNISTESGKQLSEAAQKDFCKYLTGVITKEKPNNKDSELIKAVVLSDLGEESKIVVKNGEKKIVASLKDFSDNVVKFSNALFKDKVVNVFNKAVAEGADFAKVSFIKSMKTFGRNRSLLGLGMASAVGCSIQPLNMYITKKKTGSDGFVGVEGRSKDNSFGFKVLKTAAAAAFVAFSVLTIGNPKNLLKNIQYKGISPTLEQFKLVYGLTIASRFLSARDKDELREGAIKDILGFSTWLLFGGFVSNGVIKLIDKIKGTKLYGKTRDEVLSTFLKSKGISTIENGKAIPFKNLLKYADKLTKTNLRYLSIAQFAGYLFSGLVLGFGIPKLNIYMTNKNEQKRKAQNAQANPIGNMLKPENMAFLSKNMNFINNEVK